MLLSRLGDAKLSSEMTERVYGDRLERLEKVLAKLLALIAYSPLSPISRQDADKLIQMLENKND